MSVLVKQIAEELKMDEGYARNAVALLFDEKCTIPFITRYRKEKTGSMTEVALCKLRDRYVYMQELNAAKERYWKVIEEHAKEKPDLREKLPQIREKMDQCLTKQELEDIYLPFKPKRKTRAMAAREKGLDALLTAIFEQWANIKDLRELARPFVSNDSVEAALKVADEDEALKGAADIFAEQINETAEYRNIVRRISSATGCIVSKRSDKVPTEGEAAKAASKYENYFDYREPALRAPSHRAMAVRRGEAEKILIVNIEVDEEAIRTELYDVIKAERGTAELPTELDEWLQRTIADAYKRLLSPAIETEIRMDIKMRSENEAIRVFASNLRNLLLLPPTPENVVCGVDPGLRTGAKIAIVSETGALLEHCVIFPKFTRAPKKPKANAIGETPVASTEDNIGNVAEEAPQQSSQAELILQKLLEKHKVTCIALGNGTGSREIDQVILKVLRQEGFEHIKRYIVNESGASVYSTDAIAREEFPDLDPTIRSAVSIARRLQDPLAELVKIDPRSLGVGQYQHDCDVTKLDNTLQETVESCVNRVGVDVNTASFKLLSYVSGIGPSVAKNIVAFRDQSGAFHTRKQLLDVTGFGPKTFEQAAGFLRIPKADNPLDNSAVHPERYEIVEKIAQDLQVPVTDLVGKEELTRSIALEKYVDDEVGMPTLLDIVKELAKPGRDPRQDNTRLHFSSDVSTINDLKPGMRLRGTVSNVTKFGCFVDIGVHQDGLVHISELPNAGGDPESIVAVGQILDVYVKAVDIERNRISLSCRKDAAEARESKVLRPSSGPVLQPVAARAAATLRPSGGPTIKPRDESSQPQPGNERATFQPRGASRNGNGGGFPRRDLSRPSNGASVGSRPLTPNNNKKVPSKTPDKGFSLNDLMSKFNNRP